LDIAVYRDRDRRSDRAMRRSGLFLLLMGFVAISTAFPQAARPDLVVEGVRLDPAKPEPGDPVQIIATIANLGRGDVVQSFDVRFKVDDLTIARRRVMRLRAGRRVELQAEWEAVEGEHRIVVEVDQLNNIPEADERNNRREVMVTVRRKGAVYSFTAEIGLTIGRTLSGIGEGFDFSLEEELFAALEAGLRKLEEVKLTLESASWELLQLGESLPPPLLEEEAITQGRAIGAVFSEMAASLAKVASALQGLNVTAAVEALGELQAELIELSKLSFPGVELSPLAEAAVHFEEASRAAQALAESLLGSGQGQGEKSLDELIAQFQAALDAAGALLKAVGEEIESRLTYRGIIFTDGEGRMVKEFHAGETLLIQVYGAVWLALEVYNSEGRLLARRVTVGERLRWQGDDNTKESLLPGEYFYRLIAERGAGEEVDLGRILISGPGP